MNRFPVLSSLALLSLVLLPAAAGAQSGAVSLTAEPGNVLRIDAKEKLQFTFLLAGKLARLELPGGAHLDVSPMVVLPLGALASGASISVFLPRPSATFWLQAVALDPSWRVVTSDVLAWDDPLTEMLLASFRAELVSTDSIPPHYGLKIRMTAPSGGYALKLSEVRSSPDTGEATEIRITLKEPATPAVTPALQELELWVNLGTEVVFPARILLGRNQADGGQSWRLLGHVQK